MLSVLRKAERIITCEDVEDFQRIGSNSESFYKCKWCEYSSVCFGHDKPIKTCRTCTSVNICDEGKWECGLANRNVELSIEDQHNACSNYNLLECLDN